MIDQETKTRIIGYSVYAGVMLIIPLVLGLVLSFVYKDWIYFEVFFVVFGLVSLLIACFRVRRRDGKNYKKHRTYYEDKKTPEYRSWLTTQFLMFGIGVLCLILSLIGFLFKLYVPLA